MVRLEKELLHCLRKSSPSNSTPTIPLPLRILHTPFHHTHSRNTPRTLTTGQPIPPNWGLHVFLAMARHADLLQTGSPTKPSLRTTPPARGSDLHGTRHRVDRARGSWQGTFMEGAGLRTKQSKTR